jgi:hypothetical protein
MPLPAHSEAASRRPLALCLFLGFFALYMLSVVDDMLTFTDSWAMVESATRFLHHGIGQGPGQMHEKWCLGQVTIDVLFVLIDELFADTPLQNLLQVRIQSMIPSSIGAGMPTLVFLIGLRLGYRKLTSVLAAVGVGLGTITWVYSQILFSETTLALLWLVVIYAMLGYTESGRLRWLVLAGVAGGYALITKTASAVALPVLPLWVVFSQWNRTQLFAENARRLVVPIAALTVPLVLFGALNLWYNHARFGMFFNSGYTAERDGDHGGFTTPLLVGLYGLAMSPGKGFFFYSPILVLGLFGMGSFLRAHRLVGLALLGIVLPLVIVHARWWAWHGDWAWGPRFMVPLTPLFGLFSLSAISHMLSRPAPQRSWRLLLTAALLSVSIGVQVVGLVFDPGRFIDIASAQSRVLRGGTYFREGKFPLLDDGIVAHFIPHFSPISGHYWMLRAALAGDDAKRSKILHNPPWRRLNPQWVPNHPERIDTSILQWWLHLDQAEPEKRGLARTLMAALCLLLGACSVLIVRRLLPAATRLSLPEAEPGGSPRS